MAGFFTLQPEDFTAIRRDDADFDRAIAAANLKAAQALEAESGTRARPVNPALLPQQGDDRPPPVNDVGPALGSTLQRARPRERPAGLTTVASPAAKTPAAAAPRTVVGELDPNLSPAESIDQQSTLRGKIAGGLQKIRGKLFSGGTSPGLNPLDSAYRFGSTPKGHPNRAVVARAEEADAWYGTPAAVDYFRKNPGAIDAAINQPIEFFETVVKGSPRGLVQNQNIQTGGTTVGIDGYYRQDFAGDIYGP